MTALWWLNQAASAHLFLRGLQDQLDQFSGTIRFLVDHDVSEHPIPGYLQSSFVTTQESSPQLAAPGQHG